MNRIITKNDFVKIHEVENLQEGEKFENNAFVVYKRDGYYEAYYKMFDGFESLISVKLYYYDIVDAITIFIQGVMSLCEYKFQS